MADKSKIEWTDSTWTPIRARNLVTGKIGWHCEHVTEACAFCYAEGLNKRLGTGLPFKPGHRKDIEIFLDGEMLTQPLRWKRPRMIFVCSMTDLFGEFVPDAWIDRMFAAMALAPQHTFQVLTKRSGRMREYVASRAYLGGNIGGMAVEIMEAATATTSGGVTTTYPIKAAAFRDVVIDRVVSGLPNVWLGVSAEDQATADARIPDLLATPAAVRFVSYEPALGPVDFTRIAVPDERAGKYTGQGYTFNALQPEDDLTLFNAPAHLDLIIAAGESGPGARPMHPDWARAARDQCAAAGVPFFFKQWGEWAPHKPVAGDDLGGDVRAGRVRIVHPTGQSDVEVYAATGGRSTIPGSRYMARVGKKRAGRLLDGVTHDAMPL